MTYADAISGNAPFRRKAIMKSIHNHTKAPHSFGIVRKNGRVDLPPHFSTFKIGQRVYFHMRQFEVVIGAVPKRNFKGRLLSCRIRRGLRTLAKYGPRATICTAQR